MSRKPPEPHAARWHDFPHLEKYFAALEPPSDPMDGWPGARDRDERAHIEEKYLRQLLSSFLQIDSLNQPTPDPADLKSIHGDLEQLTRMCEYFAVMHESSGRELRTMHHEALAKIKQWLRRE